MHLQTRTPYNYRRNIIIIPVQWLHYTWLWSMPERSVSWYVGWSIYQMKAAEKHVAAAALQILLLLQENKLMIGLQTYRKDSQPAIRIFLQAFEMPRVAAKVDVSLLDFIKRSSIKDCKRWIIIFMCSCCPTFYGFTSGQ